jgi:hypothetical protein
MGPDSTKARSSQFSLSLFFTASPLRNLTLTLRLSNEFLSTQVSLLKRLSDNTAAIAFLVFQKAQKREMILSGERLAAVICRAAASEGRIIGRERWMKATFTASNLVSESISTCFTSTTNHASRILFARLTIGIDARNGRELRELRGTESRFLERGRRALLATANMVLLASRASRPVPLHACCKAGRSKCNA